MMEYSGLHSIKTIIVSSCWSQFFILDNSIMAISIKNNSKDIISVSVTMSNINVDLCPCKEYTIPPEVNIVNYIMIVREKAKICKIDKNEYVSIKNDFSYDITIINTMDDECCDCDDVIIDYVLKSKSEILISSIVNCYQIKYIVIGQTLPPMNTQFNYRLCLNRGFFDQNTIFVDINSHFSLGNILSPQNDFIKLLDPVTLQPASGPSGFNNRLIKFDLPPGTCATNVQLTMQFSLREQTNFIGILLNEFNGQELAGGFFTKHDNDMVYPKFMIDNIKNQTMLTIDVRLGYHILNYFVNVGSTDCSVAFTTVELGFNLETCLE